MYLIFSHKSELSIVISILYRILVFEEYSLVMKRVDHQVFHLFIWKSCRGCSLSELVGSRVLFLREQVRDLRVQEFLRELVVGVATPSDLGDRYNENLS